MRCRHWTAAEDALLRECYADSHNVDLGAALGRSPAAVLQRALALGLHKAPAYIAEHCRRFKAGMQPWNTGREFQPGGRSVETRFKPGELSGRAAQLVQPIGTLRIVTGNTLQRKVAETPGPNHLRWRSVHELVWSQAHGPVPAGHVVVFRAGQHTTVEAEITLDRLELVSRAELMRRNSVHRHGPEIAGLSRLKGALMRQIRRAEAAAEERS